MRAASGLPTLRAALLAAPDIDGPDVLIVGAGLGTGVQALWHRAATILGERFQVIGWDLPGHGLSPAHRESLSVQDLADAVIALVASQRDADQISPTAKVFYAGVSVSGAVGMHVALREPSLLDGLFVICSATSIGDEASWRERATAVEASGTPTMVAGSAQRWFGPGFLRTHPDRASPLLHTLQDADRSSYARLCEALADYDLRDQLSPITVPVLAINGEEDQICSPERGAEIAESVRHGTSTSIRGVGHQAPIEAPAVIAELLTTHADAWAPPPPQLSSPVAPFPTAPPPRPGARPRTPTEWKLR